MRSLFEKKLTVILLALIALASMTFLSIGLRNVSFSNGQTIAREDAEPVSTPPDLYRYPLEQIPRMTQIIVFASLTALLVLIGFLLSPEARKKILRIIIRVAITAWGIYYLMKNYPEIFAVFNFGFNSNAAQTASDAVSDLPPPVFTPPQTTPLLSYAITLALTFALLYIVWILYRNRPEAGGPAVLKKIAGIARSSLRDLSSDNESTDVIMNCYYRMSDVVADKKSLQRGTGMTPGEFATRLEDSGLPGDAVRGLTRLFEGVRYGRKRTGTEERKEAVDCLTSILNHCGETI